MPSCLTLAAIGLHLASYHTDAPTNKAYGPAYNNVNPGVYAATKCGLIVGTYRNSIRRQTAYIGLNQDIKLTKNVGLFGSIALATGYEKTIISMGMIGAYGQVNNYRLRLGYIPKFEKMNDTHVFHVTIERRF